MATTKYSDITSEVLPLLAAFPPDPLVENVIKRSVIEFCSDSLIWKHLPDPLDVEAGESGYIIEVPSGSEVATVMSVAFDGDKIEPRSTEWLDTELIGWRADLATPKYFTQVESNQIILAPVPDSNITGGLVLTIALRPQINSIGFPKWIANKYLYQIADGAASKLMLMSGKAWSDPANGAYRKSQFDSAIAEARETSAKGLGRSVIRTTSYN